MKKEFLSEERYQNTKKALVVVAVIIFIIPTILGYMFFIKPGLDINKEAEAYPVPTEEEIQTQEDEIDTKYDALLEELETKYEKLEEEVEAKYTKGTWDDGYIEEVGEKNDELFELTGQKYSETIDLESERSEEKLNIESVIGAEIEQARIQSQGRMKTMVGSMIALAGILIGTSILFIAFGRNILGFQVQQTMPIAQEGIEKITPTVGNLAKEVTKGVKEGLTEDKE